MTVIARLVPAFCLSALWLSAGPVNPSAPDLMRRTGLRFEPNRGQLDPGVRFAARTPVYSVLLTERRAVLAFPSWGGEPARQVGIEMVGAAADARLEAARPLGSRSDYFVGKTSLQWRTGVPHYGAVRCRDAWPGIDMVYYGNGSRLEYDFVLRPGADAAAIRMRFHAAGRLNLTAAGDLEVRSGAALVVQKRPVLYQYVAGVRREVRGEYTLLGGDTVGVKVEAYDTSRPLTIDPVVYGTFLGAGKLDQIVSVKTDAAGMIWVAGYTQTGDIRATANAYDDSFGGATDVFVARFDPAASGAASLLYYSYIGGSSTDTATDMVLDKAGNVYVTGTTASTDFPCSSKAPQTTLGGSASTDAFVVKLNPAAGGTDALVFSTYLGGSLAEVGNGVAVDGSGAIYLVGTTQSTDFPVTSSGYAREMWGDKDAFIAKIDPVNGWVIHATYLGGEKFDEGRAIAVTPAGIVYVAGVTESPTFPMEGAGYRTTLQGKTDIWLARMDLSQTGLPSLPYSTYFGGSDLDDVRKIALDAAGRVLITGYTMSPDFPVTGTAYQNHLAGNADVFVARLDPSAGAGQFVQYATFLGGQGGEAAYDITTDADGNVYLAGYTLSPDFPVTKDAAQAVYGFGTDTFVVKMDIRKTGAAALLYSTYLGQDGHHVAQGLAVRGDGSIWVGGYTGNGNMQTTGTAYQNVYSGGLYDGFLVAIK